MGGLGGPAAGRPTGGPPSSGGFGESPMKALMDVRLGDLLSMLVGQDTRWSMAETPAPQGGLAHMGLSALEPPPPPRPAAPASAAPLEDTDEPWDGVNINMLQQRLKRKPRTLAKPGFDAPSRDER